MLTPAAPAGLDEARALVAARCARGVSGTVRALAGALVDRHGPAVQAVLVYGSCYRRGIDHEGLVDLYVLVDGYRRVLAPPCPRWLLGWLGPTVFRLEQPVGGATVRAKCALLSLDAFERGVEPHALLPHLWGRFAQPAGLVWSRSPAVEERVTGALVTAARTFATRVVGLLPSRFEARDLWTVGLGLSYATELRAERPEAVAAVHAADAEHYERLTRAVLRGVPGVRVVAQGPPARYEATLDAAARRAARVAWAVRRLAGKLGSIPRLGKGLVSFRGGPDYILWKIERHSGVRVEASAWARRHPLLAGWGVLWRLYRRGGFR